MPVTSKSYNSISDQLAQQIRNNQNAVEILTSLDQAVQSNDSYVTVNTIDSNGNQITTQFPTIGYFKQQLDILTKTVQILSGIEGNPAAIQIADNAYKRIITADINVEPNQIGTIPPVSTFTTDPNWIFKNLLNPQISVQLDLTGQIDQNIQQIESRRFIVEFDQIISVDANGNDTITLTPDAQLRLAEFNANYNGKNNINIIQFVQWLQQPGLVNQVDTTLIDDDFYKIDPNILQFSGNFTVLSTQVDTVNKKLWYVLDTLTYFDVSNPSAPPSPVTLKVGDLVNVNPNTAGVISTTVYEVIEISTITSDLRVRFQQVFGQDPIPVRLNALSYYSEFVNTRTVKVPVGFDEYCVVFVRPYDSSNNLLGKDWSSGTGFYTNNLRMDSAGGVTFTDYYASTVLDYGIILDDLVKKKVPNLYGVIPNAPVLDEANFTVVQTNAHLTNSSDAENIRDLHNQKNNLASQIDQLNSAVAAKQRTIQTTQFTSDVERKKANDELATLQTKLTTTNATHVSTINSIIANVKNINQLDPTYSVRGFWPMPLPVTPPNNATVPQQVVQFEVWYTRINTSSGAALQVATFPDIDNTAARVSSSQNTTAIPNLTLPKKVNASYSNWVKAKTDVLQRVQNLVTGAWSWVIQDPSDATTPSINSLDIPISAGESIQIKIKAISEVGYPEAPLESAFSNTITVDFPSNLSNILTNDKYILSDAQADTIQVQMQQSLTSKGLDQHLSTSITQNNIYFAHPFSAIYSGVNDPTTGLPLTAEQYINTLVARITALEEELANGTGELQLILTVKGQNTTVYTGNALILNVNLEDYMTQTKIGLTNSPVDGSARTYENTVYTVSDYSLQIQNVASTAVLGILSSRNYAQLLGALPSTFAWSAPVSATVPNTVAQPIWIKTTNQVLFNDNTSLLTAGGVSLSTTDYQGPTIGTQVNNQWIWLENKDISGNTIYNDIRASSTTPLTVVGTATPGTMANLTTWTLYRNYSMLPPLSTDGVGVFNEMHLSLINPTQNLGYNNNNLYGSAFYPHDADPLPVSTDYYSPNNSIGYVVDVTDLKNWTYLINVNSYISSPTSSVSTTALSTSTNTYNSTNMGVAVCPIITSFNDITDISAQKIHNINAGSSNAITIPLKIYFRMFCGTAIQSYNTTQTQFVDTSWAGVTGDMPLLASGAAAWTNTGNKLQINFYQGATQYLKAGDKVVLSNISSDSVIGSSEGIPLVVLSATSTTAILNLPITGTPAVTTGVITQVHLYTSSAGMDSQFKQFSVYGNLPGFDTPYVSNYVEIYSSSVAPKPAVFSRTLRFYMETETSARPVEFQFNWQVTQFKKVSNVATVNNSNLNLSAG